MQLHEIKVRLLLQAEVSQYNQLMESYHYLGALQPVGETLRYVAVYQEQWIALLSFSSAALKCAVRDQWIGWRYRYQFDRLNLITNNSRFVILPDWHYPNVASHLLSQCQRRLCNDWIKNFNHPLLLLETFVDPVFFKGTIYQATNWRYLGMTQGYRRARSNLSYTEHHAPKKVFIYPLHRRAKKCYHKHT